MFFKTKWLYRPVWDCNALSGWTYTGKCMYTGIVYILLNRLMPLKFCNQTKRKSFEKI